jgi:hypothetical protein
LREYTLGDKPISVSGVSRWARIDTGWEFTSTHAI